MKSLVTGGAGFIGTHLTHALVVRGDDVRVIDNLSGSSHDNIPEGVTFHNEDIRNFDRIAPLFSGVDCVFHLAALPRVQPSIEDPRTTHAVNVDGTLNVLVAARDAKVKRVVYSASSSAYGDTKTYPFTEDMPTRPLSPYGLQKYMGEELCALFSHIYELETVSLRYFNVYGPGAPTDGPYALVIGRLLEQRRRGEKLTIVPDGTQSRDFTHVCDVVRANLLAQSSVNVGKGDVINIGGGSDKSVLEIAHLIGGSYTFIEPRLEPKRTLADISRASKLLGWQPEITLEEGIQELKKLNGITE